MDTFLIKFADIARQKGKLLREEAALWEEAAKVLLSEPHKTRPAIIPDQPVSRTDPTIPSFGILRLAEVSRLIGLSRSSIYKLMTEGNFPMSTQLGARSVGWQVQDIERWLADRKRRK